MKVDNISVTVFSYKTSLVSDTDGHTHPGSEHDADMAMLAIESDDGVTGFCFGSPQALRPYLVENYIKKVFIGEDPLRFEKLWQSLARWQRGSGGQLSDKTIAIAEMALLDLVGKKLNIPLWKLLGGFRDEVPAYGSTMCGDELKTGLSSPDDYGDFALKLMEQGYKAIKLHTWMPPVSWAPNVRMDIRACAAVREAVGQDFPLMLDANHWYSRTEAFDLGKAIQELGYYWYEEPMDEHSSSSYKWLADNLDIPILGPEYAEGKFHTRAEWISNGICDIVRTGTMDVGGITPSIKIAHLAEAFNMDCEIHGGGAGNLAVLGAISNARWYERGLLHPFVDYNAPPAYLHKIIDPMDNGMIRMPDLPGLGEDINFDYIKINAINKY